MVILDSGNASRVILLRANATGSGSQASVTRHSWKKNINKLRQILYKFRQVYTCLLYSISSFSLLVHNGTILDISTSKSKNPRTSSVYFPSCSLSEYKDRSWNYIIYFRYVALAYLYNLGCFKQILKSLNDFIQVFTGL